MPTPMLTEITRVPTSGARAVETFVLGGSRYLVVPQLAVDIPGGRVDMNGGDSDAAGVAIMRLAADGGLERVPGLEVPGGEDAEFFRIGERSFLAIASIRSGSGPYEYAQPQRIFEWVDGRFRLFQSIPGYAAKQWRHLQIADRHFLALAQGVGLPGHEDANQPSRIYEWTGTGFEVFAEVDSAWGYNWAHLSIDGTDYLAHADHLAPSLLLRWNGERFMHHQVLTERSARAYAKFSDEGSTYLVIARLQEPSQVLRWDHGQFVPHQELPGLGGREITVLRSAGELYAIRVNFITGTPADPITALDSHVYRWEGSRLDLVSQFPTSGGTDLTWWTGSSGSVVVAVSNSLSADVRFATDTVIYEFNPRPRMSKGSRQ